MTCETSRSTLLRHSRRSLQRACSTPSGALGRCHSLDSGLSYGLCQHANLAPSPDSSLCETIRDFRRHAHSCACAPHRHATPFTVFRLFAAAEHSPVVAPSCASASPSFWDSTTPFRTTGGCLRCKSLLVMLPVPRLSTPEAEPLSKPLSSVSHCYLRINLRFVDLLGSGQEVLRHTKPSTSETSQHQHTRQCTTATLGLLWLLLCEYAPWPGCP